MRETKETVLLAEIRELLKEIKGVLENAVQISETKKIPVRQEAETGEEVG